MSDKKCKKCNEKDDTDIQAAGTSDMLAFSCDNIEYQDPATCKSTRKEEDEDE
tara:strand:+ start:321 stop:479 length:159 start_codon:yes stop_codon:yes gene_type:complete